MVEGARRSAKDAVPGLVMSDRDTRAEPAPNQMLVPCRAKSFRSARGQPGGKALITRRLLGSNLSDIVRCNKILQRSIVVVRLAANA